MKVLTWLLMALMVTSTTIAPNANAIIGGKNAGKLRGQVQFWVNGNIACSGTLIGGNWVLTAKHCIEDRGATVHNSSIYAGSRHIGEGHRMIIAGIYKHPSLDAALLNLWNNVPNYQNVVVGYGIGSPGLNAKVSLSGWGWTEPELSPGTHLPATRLQIASMRVNRYRYNDPRIGSGDTAIQYVYNGSGVPGLGDSGAGLYISRRIFAVHVLGDDVSNGSGVLTEALQPWIEYISGIEPS
ncbi:trypsin-like serine protease [Nonomuraea lactucae]|uniref:trypsin-like serine protease n=1 Tax=Nonomuraea lactucae TaxID=2249762 RepID=UPI0013B35995|nr:trypsin-like serine protease [Nonomuraea lactucae]